jgi:hypothetical protein
MQSFFKFSHILRTTRPKCPYDHNCFSIHRSIQKQNTIRLPHISQGTNLIA